MLQQADNNFLEIWVTVSTCHGVSGQTAIVYYHCQWTSYLTCSSHVVAHMVLRQQQYNIWHHSLLRKVSFPLTSRMHHKKVDQYLHLIWTTWPRRLRKPAVKMLTAEMHPFAVIFESLPDPCIAGQVACSHICHQLCRHFGKLLICCKVQFSMAQ